MNYHWADQFAQQVIDSGRYRPYWVDDMKTPSGRVHVGSLRAVVTHGILYQALLDKGAQAKFSYVLEDHDPFDKIPQYLDQATYQPHLGKPLYKVPSPEPGYDSFGHRWGKEYQEIFNLLGVYPEVIWGSQLYLSGQMNNVVRECLDKAHHISQIYKTLYGKKRPRDWLPINMVCQQCGKLSTTKAISWDGHQVTYQCRRDTVDFTSGCGYQGSNTPFDGHSKLPWKVEWPCKWKVIGVTIEGAGKDHASAGGSFDFAKLMCQTVINYPFPFAFGHEFFLTSGRKMSSSKGVGSSAREISQLIPPYLIRLLVVRVKYNRAINFDPSGSTIPDAFDQYDQAARSYWDDSDPKLKRIFELSQVSPNPPRPHFLPRFRDVAQYLQDPKINLRVKFAQTKGSPLNKQELATLEERVKYAKIWLKGYAPQEKLIQVSPQVPKQASQLTADQKSFLLQVNKLLESDWPQPETLQRELFDLAKSSLGPRAAFQAIYLSLIGKTHGPKAAWLLLNNKDFSRNRFQAVQTSISSDTAPSGPGWGTTSPYLSLDDQFASTYPSATVAWATIKGVSVKETDLRLEQDKLALKESLHDLSFDQISQYPEIQSYRDMYKKMRVKYQSRRPSPEALLRRLAQGKDLYTVNTCVDAYNLVVIKNRISVGAFDLAKITFPTVLKIAQGGEEILLLGDDAPTQLKPGEVAYFDGQGPYNLDYNYRDAKRTAVTSDTSDIWLNVEGVNQITPQQVQATLDQTIAFIQKYCGGTVQYQGLLSAS